MANILKAAGEEAALLALMDPYIYFGRRWATLGMWLDRRGSSAGLERMAETTRYLWFRVKKGFDWLYGGARRTVLFTIWRYYRKFGKTLPPWLRRPDRANHLIRLVRGDMAPFDGNATYFRARFGPRSPFHTDVHDTWRELIRGQLEVIAVPGHHSQIIHEPYIGALARELQKALVAARANHA